MDKQFHTFISSIEDSRIPEKEKTTLVTTLQKDGMTEKFADLFKAALSREVQKRGEAIAAIISDFDAQFSQLLKEFEKEGVSLEQSYTEKISALDPLDTHREQLLLDTYTTALKNQRNAYEKKVRDLTVALSKATAKFL